MLRIFYWIGWACWMIIWFGGMLEIFPAGPVGKVIAWIGIIWIGLMWLFGRLDD